MAPTSGCYSNVASPWDQTELSTLTVQGRRVVRPWAPPTTLRGLPHLYTCYTYAGPLLSSRQGWRAATPATAPPSPTRASAQHRNLPALIGDSWLAAGVSQQCTQKLRDASNPIDGIPVVNLTIRAAVRDINPSAAHGSQRAAEGVSERARPRAGRAGGPPERTRARGLGGEGRRGACKVHWAAATRPGGVTAAAGCQRPRGAAEPWPRPVWGVYHTVGALLWFCNTPAGVEP